MTLRVLVGKPTVSKSDHCITEIRRQLITEPYGKPIIYLVPDQMTFQQEYKLLQDHRVKGSIRAQVLSFSRLAFRVMQECGGLTKAFISSTGIQMMLRKIIEQKKTDWKIFQKSIEKKGFIEQLEAMLTEFKRYRITPDMLSIHLNEGEQSQDHQALKYKLEDLYYLYQSLTDALAHQYIDTEDRLALLAKKIPESDYLKDATVYVDGFHRLTPQEQEVLGQLVKSAQDMTFTLTLDMSTETAINQADIFSQTKETLSVLQALAADYGQPITIEQIDAKENVTPYMYHLANHFDQRPSPPYRGKVPIQLACAVHPRAEIEGVAQEILSMVRDRGYRYRDMAILIRDGELYHDLIKTIFEDYQIPVFIDEKKPMLHHPLIELIRSAIDVILTNWRYDAVFRVLKTGLIPPADEVYPLDQDAIDTLENYVLEYGMRGRKQWLSHQPWLFQRFKGFDQATQTDQERLIQEKINAYRDQVVASMSDFDQAIREADTIKERTIILYEWLEQLRVNKVLETWQTQLDQEGKVEQAREQEQVWQAVIHLFDEIVEMIGEEKLSLQLFQQTLEAGLDTLTYAHVPPTLDQVVVGSIDRSRLTQVKVSFLVGVNEGMWPMKPGVDTVLSEDERLQLRTYGITLAESETQQLIDDWFYIYLAVTLATERLWLSYPLSDTEGKAKTPASLIKRIQSLFPDIADPVLLQDPEEMVEAERFITTPAKTLSALTAQLAKYQRAYPIHPIWWSVLNWFLERKQEEMIANTLESLFYKNQPVSLSKETTKQLYNKELTASVSRMEMYHRCSYQHFAQYSLNLAERKTYKLDAPDIGQLFHEALKKITEWVQQEGLSFSDLGKDEANNYAMRAINQLAPVLQHQILHSSNRYQYMQKKLEQIIARATYVLSEQSRKSQFSPVGLEVGFGLPNSPLSPVRMALPNGYEIVLRGRIDRVDQAKWDDQLYLRIIDYKSSAKGLNLVEVYYGLALQMLAYLDVILMNSENWLGMKASPAGVLYFHVHDPILNEPQALSQSTLEEKLFKKYKMQGLLVDQEHVVQMMDADLETGMSPVVPAGLKKDGTFRSGSQIASTETFQTLQNYVRQLITQAGLAITEGEVALNPYQQAQKTACEFCAFKSVCQFDASLPNHHYRKLLDVKDEMIIKKIIERGQS
ncbi:helicase-exonuclease AddAB subunit AddB [Amphibacillus cookii]|uniref:helicase-exonuclease AddAB subunit AddB n=1 Tax=Amphibacillus cookii TaxID=767787 RepID=UPI001958F6BF|nr:helicase-exonuclease AddAB subunit AddB [Amphibacillus cookii]MBM7541488.1 ATP-dependent helicase/nuclease subunit B [Amphibacillus cookii]